MSVFCSEYFLPRRIASHSYTLVELLLIWRQRVSVPFKHHLKILDCPSLESKDQNHVINFFLLLIFFILRFEDIDEAIEFATHELFLAMTVSFLELLIIYLQLFFH